MNGIKRDIMAAFFPVELCNLYWSKEAENITDPKILFLKMRPAGVLLKEKDFFE